jgi:hypothetical protein
VIKMSDKKSLAKTSIVLMVLVALAVATITTGVAHAADQAPVPLGTAANFGVLAATTVTSTGATTVQGDLGLYPGSSVTGFPPGTVTGTQHINDTVAALAQADLTTAYNDLAGRTGATNVSGNIGGQTLTPGLYKSTSSLEISSGDLTLDAQGNASAIFIFQIASTLTTTTDRKVILTGSANAFNVFWQVGSSATIGTNSTFKGNILAYASITVTSGAMLEGRALARTGAVTLDTNGVIPEFPTILILPLFTIATLLAIIVYKKRNLGYTKRLRMPS